MFPTEDRVLSVPTEASLGRWDPGVCCPGPAQALVPPLGRLSRGEACRHPAAKVAARAPLTGLSFQMIESSDLSEEKIRMKETVEGLQDKLNKRDKEVAALTSQTEVLRAQVSALESKCKSGEKKMDAVLKEKRRLEAELEALSRKTHDASGQLVLISQELLPAGPAPMACNTPPRHSPGPERDLSREVHKAEWRIKEQKLKEDIRGLREKLTGLVRGHSGQQGGVGLPRCRAMETGDLHPPAAPTHALPAAGQGQGAVGAEVGSLGTAAGRPCSAPPLLQTLSNSGSANGLHQQDKGQKPEVRAPSASAHAGLGTESLEATRTHRASMLCGGTGI
uniref:Uncharacterized protein n=1 Tax=Spermophilus dauricus TaxID=99837 RepID=A0A8C9QBI8_SPEDA